MKPLPHRLALRGSSAWLPSAAPHRAGGGGGQGRDRMHARCETLEMGCDRWLL